MILVLGITIGRSQESGTAFSQLVFDIVHLRTCRMQSVLSTQMNRSISLYWDVLLILRCLIDLVVLPHPDNLINGRCTIWAQSNPSCFWASIAISVVRDEDVN